MRPYAAGTMQEMMSIGIKSEISYLAGGGGNPVYAPSNLSAHSGNNPS